MNRLDEIEREHRTVLADYTDKGCGPEVDPEGEQYTARDVLALVAVARATIKCRRIRLEMARKCDDEWDRLASQLLIAEAEESAALAPLLASTDPDAGGGQ